MEITKKQIDNDDGALSLTEEQKIDHLIKALDENTKVTKMLYDMLTRNNACTEFLYERAKVNLTFEQQLKDFIANVGANVVGNFFSIDEFLGKKKK